MKKTPVLVIGLLALFSAFAEPRFARCYQFEYVTVSGYSFVCLEPDWLWRVRGGSTSVFPYVNVCHAAIAITNCPSTKVAVELFKGALTDADGVTVEVLTDAEMMDRVGVTKKWTSKDSEATYNYNVPDYLQVKCRSTSGETSWPADLWPESGAKADATRQWVVLTATDSTKWSGAPQFMLGLVGTNILTPPMTLCRGDFVMDPEKVFGIPVSGFVKGKESSDFAVTPCCSLNAEYQMEDHDMLYCLGFEGEGDDDDVDDLTIRFQVPSAGKLVIRSSQMYYRGSGPVDVSRIAVSGSAFNGVSYCDQRWISAQEESPATLVVTTKKAGVIELSNLPGDTLLVSNVSFYPSTGNAVAVAADFRDWAPTWWYNDGFAGYLAAGWSEGYVHQLRCRVTGTKVYAVGKKATLVCEPGEGEEFDRWEFVDGTTPEDATVNKPTLTFTVPAVSGDYPEIHVRPVMRSKASVITAAVPVGVGTVTGSGDYIIPEMWGVGDSCTLSASPAQDEDYTFAGWNNVSQWGMTEVDADDFEWLSPQYSLPLVHPMTLAFVAVYEPDQDLVSKKALASALGLDGKVEVDDVNAWSAQDRTVTVGNDEHWLEYVFKESGWYSLGWYLQTQYWWPAGMIGIQGGSARALSAGDGNESRYLCYVEAGSTLHLQTWWTDYDYLELENGTFEKYGKQQTLGDWLDKLCSYGSYVTNNLAGLLTKSAADSTRKTLSEAERYRAKMEHALETVLQLGENPALVAQLGKFGFTVDYGHLRGRGEFDFEKAPTANATVDAVLKEVLPKVEAALTDLASIPATWKGNVCFSADAYPLDEDILVDLGDVRYMQAFLKAVVAAANCAKGYDLGLDYSRLAEFGQEIEIPSVANLSADRGWENVPFHLNAPGDRAMFRGMKIAVSDDMLYVRLTKGDQYDALTSGGSSFNGLCIESPGGTLYCLFWSGADYLWACDDEMNSYEVTLDAADVGNEYLLSFDLSASAGLADDLAGGSLARLHCGCVHEDTWEFSNWSVCTAYDNWRKVLLDQSQFLSKVRDAAALKNAKKYVAEAIKLAQEADALVEARTDGEMHLVNYDAADEDQLGKARELAPKALASLEKAQTVSVSEYIDPECEEAKDLQGFENVSVYLGALFAGKFDRSLLPQSASEEVYVPCLDSIPDPTLAGLLPEMTDEDWVELARNIGCEEGLDYRNLPFGFADLEDVDCDAGKVLTIELPVAGADTPTVSLENAKELPSGMKLVQDKASKIWSLTGTPTLPGVYTVHLKVVNSRKKTAYGAVTITVGNFRSDYFFVDEELAFDPGVEIDPVDLLDCGLDFEAGDALVVTGLPKGYYYNAVTRQITGASVYPGTYTVTFTASVNETDARGKSVKVKSVATAFWTVNDFPSLSVTVVTDDEVSEAGGTVVGAGNYPANQRVALEAKPKAGYVFAGWYGADEDRIGNVDPRTPTIKYKTIDIDEELLASFVSAEDDADSIGVELPTTCYDEWEGRQTTVCLYDEERDVNYVDLFAGVMTTQQVEVTSLSLPTVTVKGLPNGLKFDTKTLCIVGVPTEACTNIVTVTVKNASVKKVTADTTFTFEMRVTGLPAWAKGTFTGPIHLKACYGSYLCCRDYSGQVTMTVGSTGKITGKCLIEGKTYTFSAKAFASAQRSDGECHYYKLPEFTLRIGGYDYRWTQDLRLSDMENEWASTSTDWNFVNLGSTYSNDFGFPRLYYVDPGFDEGRPRFGRGYAPMYQTFSSRMAELGNLPALSFDRLLTQDNVDYDDSTGLGYMGENDYLSVKIDARGKVTVSGRILGTSVLSSTEVVTFSRQWYDVNTYRYSLSFYVYLPPNTRTGFPGFAKCVLVDDIVVRNGRLDPTITPYACTESFPDVDW